MRRVDRGINDKKEIVEIILGSDVCRLAFSDNNIPYIVSMNFGYEDSDIPTLYFHCAKEGKKLDILSRNNIVCFQFDLDHELIKSESDCGWSMNYKSVVGMGIAEIVENNAEKTKGMDLIMKHYSGRDSFSYDTKVFDFTTIFKVTITEVTGKKKGY